MEGSRTAVEYAPEITLLKECLFVKLGPLLYFQCSIFEGILQDEEHAVLDGTNILFSFFLDLD